MGRIIEGDYPQFEQFWPEYSKNISLGSLLGGIIHEKDDAGGIIKTSLNVDWMGKAPKLSNQQIEELEQKLLVPAGAENVEKVANLLRGYTALEMLAAGEDTELGTLDVAGMMRAKTVAGYLLDFASAALDKDKEWCKTRF
jgi:hypothetical protein